MFKKVSVLCFIAMLATYCFSGSKVIIDENFENGYKNWNIHRTEGSFSLLSTDSGKVLKVSRKSINGDNSTMLIYPIPPTVVAGKHVLVEAKVKADNVEVGDKSFYGGHIDFEIRTVKSSQWESAPFFMGPFDWDLMTFEFDMPEDAKKIDFRIGLQGAKGTIYFDYVKVFTIE
jgi:hypothetical protein